MSNLIATIQTEKGAIRLNLYAEQAPLTVANFIHLAKNNFYQNNQFHRVIADFVIQGGCPLGTGTGGPGYRFADEFHPELKHDSAGILSMANAGPNTNGSQFFVTHGPTPHLDNMHTVFGKVVDQSDLDVVMDIRQNDTIQNITIEGDDSALMTEMAEQIAEWNQYLKTEA